MVKLNDSSKTSLGARGFSFVPMSCEEYLPISLYKGVVLPRPSKTASDIRNLSHSLIKCGRIEAVYAWKGLLQKCIMIYSESN